MRSLKMTPEGKVKAAIVKYLKNKGIYWFRKNQVAGDMKGIPDIIAIDNNGIFVGIEVKSVQGKQSLAQIKQQGLIENTNGVYILAYFVEDVKNYFEGGE